MSQLKALLLLLFSFSYVFSEDLDSYEVVTVVSTIPKPSDEIIIAVDKIDRDFLDKTQPKNLSSLLRESLAIDVSTNGGIGQLSSAFLRGSNSNHTLVKVNGIKINPSTAGGASIYNLDSDLISNIEIGYGPLSAVHGSTALGGVIDISTRPQTQRSNSSVGFSIGPDNFEKELIRFNQQFTESSFLNIGLSRTNTDGYPVLTNSTLDRGYENTTIITNLEVNSEIGNFELSSWSAEGRVEYLVFGSPVSQEYENYAYGIENSNYVEGMLFYKINLNASKDLIEQNNPNFLGQLDLTNTKRDSLEIIVSEMQVFSNPEDFVLGMYIEDEAVDYSSYGTLYKEKITTKSFFGSSALSILGTDINASFRNSDHDTYKSNLSWNFEILKNLNESWRIGILSGSSFRSPVSSELYGFGGNVNLEPEINKSREINLKRSLQNADLILSIFSSNFSNLINFDYQDYVLKNINKASNKGIELRYRLQKEDWGLLMIVKAQDPKDEEENQLLRRSKKSASLTLSRELNGFIATANLSYFGERVDFGGINLPSFNLVNIALTKDFNKKFNLSLKLENIMDKDYFTAATSNDFYANQGRSAWLKINYELGE
jgi:vitamin B12 transporter